MRTRPAGDIASIQYLRGIAAMLVVFAHANDQFDSALHLRLFSFGVSGVDLFFVISGFVMTYTAATHRYGRSEFLLRRIARIAPLYWVMTLLIAILVVVAPTLFKTTQFSWPSLVTSLLFIPFPSLGRAGYPEPLLKLGWTLNYEMFFYLCFAVVLATSAWRRGALLALVFASAIVLAQVFPHSVQLSYYANPITFEFLFGCALGAMFVSGWLDLIPLPVAAVAAVAGATLLVPDSANAPLSQFRFVLYGVPAAMIVLGCLAWERRRAFRNAFLRRLGDATYSVYLTHIFVVMALSKCLSYLHLAQDPVAVWAFIALSVIVSAPVGMAVYEYFERPLVRWAKQLLVRMPPALAPEVA